MGDWSNFFQGELGAAAALAGLLFVSVSVNQSRILQLRRTADRGIEALVILLLVLIVTTLALVPGQPQRIFGIEIVAVSFATLAVVMILQKTYLRDLEPAHRRRSRSLVWVNRVAVAVIALAGMTLILRPDGVGLYFLPLGILLSFMAAGASAWVLLIEINR